MTEDEAVHAESVGLALFVALETLTPAERLAFLLHDMFAVPYDEIAPIVGTSAGTARRLASRARRRVRGMPDSADARGDRRGGERGPALDAGGSSVVAARTPRDDADQIEARSRRELVSAFLAASRATNFETLLQLLDQDVVLRADAAAIARGAGELVVSATADAATVESSARDLVVGATAVAGAFAGRAEAARAILVDGIAGAVWSHRGVPQIVFRFTFDGGRITAIELLADPSYLRHVQLTAYESRSEGPGTSSHRQWD